MKLSVMHTLTLLPLSFAVCRLEPDALLPAWASRGSGFVSITRTEDELSVVCGTEFVPAGVPCEIGWRVFKLEGPFPFEMTGVLASVLNPLAAAGAGIFAISTYDTDYVLVKQENLARAVDALRAAGHTVRE